MFAIRDDRTEVLEQDFVDAWEKIQQEETDDEDVSRTFH
jgi:proteasome regulatory subunit